MSEKYKLGLSRNRLFEFNSTVVFCGKFKCEADESTVQKSIKMLSCKEPVITANVVLESNSDAFIVTGSVQPQVDISLESAKDIIDFYEKNPLRFYDRLFEFKISCDGYFIIAGHTVFCDAKSLLRLAASFAGFYNKTDLSVESGEIYTFSQPKSLPVDVLSPVINKLSSELDDDWQKNAVCYGIDDYNAAREDYLLNKPETGSLIFRLSNSEINKVREHVCSTTDFSSVVCYAFYKSIIKNFKHEKNSSKMRIWADRRFFHGGNKRYCVGAYNGTVSVSLTKKELRKSGEEQLKLFHTDIYRALTSPYRVFSDEVLLKNIQSNYCDSAYMYMAGKNKFKSSKNLAENYSCMKRELCEFFYCNLTQQYWDGLSFFKEIFVNEPFNYKRSPFFVSFAECAAGGVCELRYDTQKVTAEQAKSILETAKNMLLNF